MLNKKRTDQILDIIKKNIEFSENLSDDSNPDVSFSSNSETDSIVSFDFEFYISDDNESIDDQEIETIDVDVFIDKANNSVQVSHPYCTNLKLLESLILEAYKSWNK